MRVLMFLLFYGIVFFGETAMAADNDKRSRLATVGANDPTMTQTTSPAEADAFALADKVMSGEITFEEAFDQHRKKHHGGKPPNWNAINNPSPILLRRPKQ